MKRYRRVTTAFLLLLLSLVFGCIGVYFTARNDSDTAQQFAVLYLSVFAISVVICPSLVGDMFLQCLPEDVVGQVSDLFQDGDPFERPSGSSAEATRFEWSREFSLEFCKRLGSSWTELAPCLEIPRHERDRFRHGEEARAILDWLAARGRQNELEKALRQIDRGDLADLLRQE